MKTGAVVAIVAVVIIAVAGLAYWMGTSSSNSNDNPEGGEPALPGMYKITFNANGGYPSSSQNVSPGGTAYEPQAPTRNGYEFEGWYTDSSAGNMYSFSTPVNSNRTLYAHWTVSSNKIYSAEDFMKITSNMSGNYKLMTSISLGSSWNPLGSQSDPFKGTLDGNGNTISYSYNGSKWTDTTGKDYYYGLFGSLSGAKITNLTVNPNVYIMAGQSSETSVGQNGSSYKYFAGGLAGSAINSDVSGCFVTGKIILKGLAGNDAFAGAVCGVVKGPVEVDNCRISTTIKSIGHFGVAGGVAGIVGNSQTLTIRGCTLSSEVVACSLFANSLWAGNSWAGGIVGYTNGHVEVNDSSSTESIKAYGLNRQGALFLYNYNVMHKDKAGTSGSGSISLNGYNFSGSLYEEKYYPDYSI